MTDYNSLFEKKLQTLKEEGSYRFFLEVNKSAQHFPQFHYINKEGIQRSAINWCSNDYLCMSTQEEVIAKLGFVTHLSGAGSSGTRNISGTMMCSISKKYCKTFPMTVPNWSYLKQFIQ